MSLPQFKVGYYRPATPLASALCTADNARMIAAASASPEPAHRVLDILVAGGGIVGLAFACAVKQASGRRLKVAVVDPGSGAGDGGLRTVALAAGSRSLMTRVGAWDALEPLTQPI